MTREFEFDVSQLTVADHTKMTVVIGTGNMALTLPVMVQMMEKCGVDATEVPLAKFNDLLQEFMYAIWREVDPTGYLIRDIDEYTGEDEE